MRNIHSNSRASLAVLTEKERRRKMIIGVYEKSPEHLTDREVMNVLGFDDMNTVKPRITEMIDDNIIVEVGKIVCETTKRPVRICTLNSGEIVPQKSSCSKCNTKYKIDVLIIGMCVIKCFKMMHHEYIEKLRPKPKKELPGQMNMFNKGLSK